MMEPSPPRLDDAQKRAAVVHLEGPVFQIELREQEEGIMRRIAPPWVVSDWCNLPEGATPPSPLALQGRVIALYAFQFRCRGCVERALPQAQEVARIFAGAEVDVIGLHTVFEAHATMSAEALRGFLAEHAIAFPVGVDAHDPPLAVAGEVACLGQPRTMLAYAMQGTPTLVLIDRQGLIRRQTLGPVADLQVGADIATLLAQRA